MQQQTKTSKWRRVLWMATLGLIVLALLTFLVLLQSSNLWKSFTVDTASDTLTLYALTSLNFFALVIFAFIFLRSVIRLVRERRALTMGSRLKSRLLIYFVAVSLLPIAAMATFSYLFLNRALEKWFSRLPENVIAEARALQNRAARGQLKSLDDKAALFAVVIESQTAFDERFLNDVLIRSDLSAVEISASSGVIIARVMRDETPPEQRSKLREILSDSQQTAARDGIGFDSSQIVLKDGRKIRIASAWQGEVSQNQAISNSPLEFERLKEQQAEVRQLGFSTLSLLTFLLIFASSWVAFHLGRSLTQPIRALAEASEEVAKGNLNHRIEVLAEDELALLVQSFNQMTAQLGENRQRLEERRNYIETVLQSLSTGVISLDEQNRITTINDAARTMFLLEDAPTENTFLEETIAAGDWTMLEKLLNRARRLGQASEQTVLLQRENASGDSNQDSSLPVALTVTALRGEHCKNAGAVLVIEDLSELISAQRAAAWQEVARRMAHEIKNPLTPIQLAAERIAKRFSAVQSSKSKVQGQPENSKDFGLWTLDFGLLAKVVNQSTETILQEVASLKAMVDEFSQFARLPHAKLETAELNEIVRQAVALYEDRFADVRLEIDLAENLPSAMLDVEQLRRVFVNLIDNAAEAFDNAQTVKIISLKTWLEPERGLLFACVSDNGRGIAKNDFGKLFQPYYSTKGRGTGLGLAIVHRIINEHAGRIRAAANQPKGAKFVIELPVAAQEI